MCVCVCVCMVAVSCLSELDCGCIMIISSMVFRFSFLAQANLSFDVKQFHGFPKIMKMVKKQMLKEQ